MKSQATKTQATDPMAKARAALAAKRAERKAKEAAKAKAAPASKRPPMKPLPDWQDRSDDIPYHIDPELLAQLGRDYGKDFQWVVYDVLGQSLDRLYNQHMLNHWEPVQRGDFNGALDHIALDYGGQRLCSRSMEISKKAREFHKRKARDAVEAMRAGAIGGNLPGVTLDSKHSSALKSNRINKTYEPLHVPDSD